MFFQEYSIILDYEIEKIFLVFQDFNIYKDLLSHLKTFQILKKSIINNRIIKYDAYVELSYLMFSLDYNCEIVFDKDLYKIIINGSDGSFKFINATWDLDRISEKKTRISYKIEFELKSKIQQKIAKKILEINSNKIRLKLIKALENKLK
jgi:ribosome-associated toxin RatA of RatAB toxin-antitoxin module